MRGLTSLNWFLGACLWALALLQPLLYNTLVGAEKGTAEANVQLIAQKQGERSATGQDGFVVFAATPVGMSRGLAQLNLEPPPADATFTYEVARSRDGDRGALVIRATPTPQAMRRTLLPLPPMVYEYSLQGGDGGRWNEYGRTRPALFGIL